MAAKRTEIKVGNFAGVLITDEKVQENGTLYTYTGYYLRNKKTGVTLAGLGGDPDKVAKQILVRVDEYFEDHSDEARELLAQENDRNTEETGIHSESQRQDS